ncbi:hypothetical protein [Kitasatospora cineracea]|uniref:Lipoprotein n=1 Tax=Kitasatospora cineracea TaxID=88074 RepID=A0A3N4RNK8_9ACTN|nr:hypothetical protein [Kitasatospora cineracea]RPE34992.1 hypothetical protein EDD38_3337 [Kitasatospora cineracea]
MRTRPLRTALLRCVLLGLPVLLAATGCRSPGALEDAGAARPVRSHPSPQPLWPSLPSPVPIVQPGQRDGREAPVPLPGLAADTLAGTDARTVLAADPALGPEERAALEHGCTGCEVRPAQYRDLDGDGSPELLTAVLFDAAPDAPRAVLHVYALRARRVLPVLAVAVLPSFGAETVGTDLIVREPTAPSVESSLTYRWSEDRLVLVDQRVKVLGPGVDVSGCPPVETCGSVVLIAPTPVPSATPTAPPAAGPTVAPAPAAPGGGAVRPVPTRTR